MTRNELIVAAAQRRIPGFAVRLQSESWLIRLLTPFVRTFNAQWPQGYITTFGLEVFYPTAAMRDRPRAFEDIAHEYVHIWDRVRAPWLVFDVLYLLPQLGAALALLALLAIGAVWGGLWWLLWLVALLALVVLVPGLPSPWRARAEWRGYTVQLAVEFWETGTISEATHLWLKGVFCGPGYYWMQGSAQFERDYAKAVESVVSGSILLDSPANLPYLDLHQIVRAAHE